MKRVASLFLPTLSTDRIARAARASSPPEPRGPAAAGFDPPRRGGGWRPGAQWAREGRFVDDRPASKADVERAVAALPPHRRPPHRELGRRSETAEMPFRAMPPDEAGPRATAPPSITIDAPTLVTVHRVGQRVVVAALCATARGVGIVPGMALTQARLIAPGIEVHDHDPQADAALLARLVDHAARKWTPGAAMSGEDGLWLDLTGVAHLFGGERRLCARILRLLARAGLDARIAVAGTPGAAHALARFAPSPLTFCKSGDEATALAPLPPAALRLDADALATARRLGVDSVGVLAAMPRAPLARRFGAATLRRLDQALGGAAEAIDPIVPVDAPRVTLRLLEPIATAEAIATVLGDAIAALVAELEDRGLGARTIILVAERVDADVQWLAVGTARATRDVRHLTRLFALRIERIDPGFGIEAITLVASRHEPLRPETVDAWPQAGSAALAPLVDHIVGRIGHQRLYRLSAEESDVPERSVGRVFPLDDAHGWPRRWPRPARLLNPPEPVDGVLALLPDHPPRRFRWRGLTYALVRGDGPERIHGEWWRSRHELRATRDYYRVEDAAGSRYWLFRRGEGDDPTPADRWYLHGMFG